MKSNRLSASSISLLWLTLTLVAGCKTSHSTGPSRSTTMPPTGELAGPLPLTQPDPLWFAHDRLRPQPPVVTPGVASTPNKVGTAPSDATVLFDGQSLTNWVSMDGSPTKWIIR